MGVGTVDGCADRLATHSAEVGFTIEKKSGFESNTSVTCMHARGLADVEAQNQITTTK